MVAPLSACLLHRSRGEGGGMRGEENGKLAGAKTGHSNAAGCKGESRKSSSVGGGTSGRPFCGKFQHTKRARGDTSRLCGNFQREAVMGLL